MTGKKDLIKLRKRRRRRQRIIRTTVHLFVWIGVVVLYYIGFSIFFDTPVEYEMKHSTDRLRANTRRSRSVMTPLQLVLDNLRARDRSVFRILFESDPYDFDSEYEQQQSLTYEKIVDRSTRRLKRELRDRVAGMEQQLARLNASYLALQERIDSTGRDCRPHSLDPARDQQAAHAAHGLLRHAHTPLLQDAAVAPGRRLHHPRRVARLRHVPTAWCATWQPATRHTA